MGDDPAALVAAGQEEEETRMPLTILGAIQADDPANRAFARRHGAQGIPWPQPYKNSVPASCDSCGGAVWLGPEQQRTRQQTARQGRPLAIFCLLCCCLTGAADGANMISLTRKGPGE
jgi:hypothetical protein